MPPFANKTKHLPANYVEQIIYNCAQTGLSINDLQYINDDIYIEIMKIHQQATKSLQSNAKNGQSPQITQTTLKRIRE